MMMLRLDIAFKLLPCLIGPSAAILLPFEARPRTHTLVDEMSKDFSNSFNFSNVNDIRWGDNYIGWLTAGGKAFQVQLDTGSSDLWLDTKKLKPSDVQDTGVSTTIYYYDGSLAQGPILIGNVTFGNFSVSQAFISAPGSNATTNGDTGLLGLGPPSQSVIAPALHSTVFGATLLQNIFAANPSEPNYMTFHLSRSEATGTTDGGIFTIGEINSTLSGISSAPKLSVVSNDSWTVLMDGIIVNGQNFTGYSQYNVTGQGPTQTLALLDTGTTLARIPSFYANAIYSAVPGAQYDPNLGVYNLPCDARIDLSFVFGGLVYPVHPIDTVQALPDSKGKDFVLGDSFLRNVYTLYDFGSFISGTTPPFIQLLSTTDAAIADSEFAALSAQRNASITGKVHSNGGGIRTSRGIFLSMLVSAVGLGLGIALM